MWKLFFYMQLFNPQSRIPLITNSISYMSLPCRPSANWGIDAIDVNDNARRMQRKWKIWAITEWSIMKHNRLVPP